MSLQAKIQDLATRIGTEFKTVRGEIEDTENASLLKAENLNDLSDKTVARTNLDVYSTTDTNTEISNAIDDLLDGAPGALDTLNEIAEALNDNPDVIAEIITELGNKLKFNEPQSLTTAEQTQGQDNLKVYSRNEIGDPTTNYVTTFEAALV